MKITTNKKRRVSASSRIPNASARRPYKKRIMASGYNSSTGIIDIPELGIYVEGVKAIYATFDINGNRIYKIVYEDDCWEYVGNGMTAELVNHGVDYDKWYKSLSSFYGSKPNSKSYKLTGKLSRLKNNKSVKASSSLSWPDKIPNYVDEVKQDLDSGEITFKEAVKELYDGGHLFHPYDIERAAKKLGIKAPYEELKELYKNNKPVKASSSIKNKYTVKAARTPKTIEVAILQGNYGYGWDDLFEFEKGATYSEIKKAKKEYDENEPQYAHRIIHRRVPNPEYQQTSNDTSGTSDVTAAAQDRYNRTLKNPGPNKVNVQPYRGDYAVVVGLENGGYAYNTYLTEFTAKNEAETFRHYVQKFGADETADQWEFQRVEACDNSVTASTDSHRYEVALDQGENEPLAVKFFDDYNKAIKWADSLHDRGGAVRITDNETGEVEELGDFQSYWNGKEDVTSCDNSVTASRIDVDNFDNTYEPDDFSQDPEGMSYEENKAVALVTEILDEYQSRTPTKLDPSIVDECYAYAHDYERSPSELADIVYSILDEAYPELVEACDCVNASVYTNPGTNKTPVESNVEYYQALADGVVALLDKNLNDGYVYKIRAEVTPEAITFLDDDNNIYWIQSGKDIIPNWDDLQDDIDELYGVVYMNAIPKF